MKDLNNENNLAFFEERGIDMYSMKTTKTMARTAWAMALCLATPFVSWAATLSYSGYISADSANPTAVFTDVSLSDIGYKYVLSGNLGGGYVATNGVAGVYNSSLSSGTLTVQFQREDGGYCKVAEVKLTETSGTIYAYVSRAGYETGGSLGTTNISWWGTPVDTADGNGYGVYDIALISPSAGSQLTITNVGQSSTQSAGNLAVTETYTLTYPAASLASGYVRLNSFAFGMNSSSDALNTKYVTCNDYRGTNVVSAIANGTGSIQTSTKFGNNSLKETYSFGGAGEATECIIKVGVGYTFGMQDGNGTNVLQRVYMINTTNGDYSPVKQSASATSYRITQELVATVVASAETSAGGNWSELFTNAPTDWTSASSAPVLVVVTDDCSIALDTAVSAESVIFDVAEGKTLTLTGANTITAASGIFVRGGTVVVPAANTLSGTAYGDGTIVYTAKPTTLTLTDSAWTGVLWLKNVAVDAADPSTLAGENSVLRLTGCTGYFNPSTKLTCECLGTLDLQDDGATKAFTVNNGWSDSGITIFAKLTGDGSLVCNTRNISQRYVFKDASSFQGTINCVRSDNASAKYLRVILGDGSSLSPDVGTITVVAGATAAVGDGKTWSADKIIVNGSLTIGSGATVSTIASSSTGSVTVTSGTGTISGVDGSEFPATIVIDPNATLAIADTSATALKIPAEFVSWSDFTYYNQGTLDLTGCTALTTLYLDMGSSTTFNLANVSLPTTCTTVAVDAGSTRSLSGYTVTKAASGQDDVTIAYAVEETKAEYANGTLEVTDVPTDATVYVLRADGTTVTATVTDTTARLSDYGTIRIDGAATYCDATFTNTVSMAYTTDSVVVRSPATGNYNNSAADKTTGIMVYDTPWLGTSGAYNIANMGDFQSDMTVVVVGQMPACKDNAMFLHIGGCNSGYNGIIIARTANDNEAFVAYNQGSTVTKLTTMTVPNADTARHVYVVTKHDTASTTTFTIYLDGIKWKTVTLDSVLEISGGVQVGSDFHGEIHKVTQTDTDGSTYVLNSITSSESPAAGYATDTTGYVNCIRLYDRILTQAEINQYSDPAEYPYVSPNGSYTRTLDETTEDFNATDAWTNASTSETAAQPASGAAATISVDSSIGHASLVNNVSAALSLESLTVSGNVTFKKSGSYLITNDGLTTIDGIVTNEYGALDISGGPLAISDDGALTLDWSGYTDDDSGSVVYISGEVSQDATNRISVIVPSSVTWYKFTSAYTNSQFALIPAHISVAKNGDTEYTSLAEAIEGATEGDTIKLLHTTRSTESLSITKNLTLDGQGAGYQLNATSLTIADGVTLTLANFSKLNNITAIDCDGTIATSGNRTFRLGVSSSGSYDIANLSLGHTQGIQIEGNASIAVSNLTATTASLLQAYNDASISIDTVDTDYALTNAVRLVNTSLLTKKGTGVFTQVAIADPTAGFAIEDGEIAIDHTANGITPYVWLDASDGSTIEETDGVVTKWTSVSSYNEVTHIYTNYTDSALTYVATDGVFGSNKVVRTNNSRLISDWYSGDKVQSIVAAIRYYSNSGTGGLLYGKSVGNNYVGKRNTGNNYWSCLRTSSTACDLWQNGGSTTTFRQYETVITVARYYNSNAKWEYLGGESGDIAIAEFIGFATTDTGSDVRKRMEAYLGNKWEIAGMQSLTNSMPLTIACGATLDLNGLARTLDSVTISGTGTATISGGELAITDAISIASGQTLVIPYGSTYTLSNEEDTVYVSEDADAGTITLTYHAARIVSTDGTTTNVYSTVAEAALAYEDGTLYIHADAEDIDLGTNEVYITGIVLDDGVSTPTFVANLPWITTYDSDTGTLTQTRPESSTFTWAPQSGSTDWSTASNWTVDGYTAVVTPGSADVVEFTADGDNTAVLPSLQTVSEVHFLGDTTLSGAMIACTNLTSASDVTVTLGNDAGFSTSGAGLGLSITLAMEITAEQDHPVGFYHAESNSPPLNLSSASKITGSGYMKTYAASDHGSTCVIALQSDMRDFTGYVTISNAIASANRENTYLGPNAYSAKAHWHFHNSPRAASRPDLFASSTYKFGSVSGNPNHYGNTTFTLEIGALNEDNTIGGNYCRTTYPDLITSGGGTIRKVGTGTLTFSGTRVHAYEINDGVLYLTTTNTILTYISADSGYYYPTIAFGGGTLKMASSVLCDFSSQITNSTEPIIIDDGDVDRTWETAIAASNTNGFQKLGSGTLTLKEVPLYTGKTWVKGGYLLVPADFETAEHYELGVSTYKDETWASDPEYDAAYIRLAGYTIGYSVDSEGTTNYYYSIGDAALNSDGETVYITTNYTGETFVPVEGSTLKLKIDATSATEYGLSFTISCTDGTTFTLDDATTGEGINYYCPYLFTPALWSGYERTLGDGEGWYVPSDIWLEPDNNATLNITEGSWLQARSHMQIGKYEGSSNAVINVYGEGSHLDITGEARIAAGAYSEGFLNIYDNAYVSAGAAMKVGFVTSEIPGYGEMNVYDGGTYYQASGDFLIADGSNSVGVVTIGDGGTIVQSNSVVKVASGGNSTGTINIAGTGKLDVLGSNPYIDIATGVGSTGIINIYDNAELYIKQMPIGRAEYSHGYLYITNGASVTVTNAMSIGYNTGSYGEVYIDGGSLTLLGKVDLGNATDYSGATGVVYVANGSLTVGGEIGVGHARGGLGSKMTIAEGGVVTQTSGNTLIGYDIDDEGFLIVDGGSFTNSANGIRLGGGSGWAEVRLCVTNEGVVYAKGDLLIANAGDNAGSGVEMSSGTLGIGGTIAIANGSSTKGYMNISGGTVNANVLQVGLNGAGSLYMSGGELTVTNSSSSTGKFEIGKNYNSTGLLVMTGGTITIPNNSVQLAGSGNGGGTSSGTLIISNGTMTASGALRYGYNGGGTIAVQIGGDESWNAYAKFSNGVVFGNNSCVNTNETLALLPGGTLVTTQITAPGTAEEACILLDGGLLVATTSGTFIPSNLPIKIGDNGAIISNDVDIVIASSSITATGSAPELVKYGSGTITFSGELPDNIEITIAHGAGNVVSQTSGLACGDNTEETSTAGTYAHWCFGSVDGTVYHNIDEIRTALETAKSKIITLLHDVDIELDISETLYIAESGHTANVTTQGGQELEKSEYDGYNAYTAHDSYGETVWQGAEGGSWTDEANWTAGVPTSSLVARFDGDASVVLHDDSAVASRIIVSNHTVTITTDTADTARTLSTYGDIVGEEGLLVLDTVMLTNARAASITVEPDVTASGDISVAGKKAIYFAGNITGSGEIDATASGITLAGDNTEYTGTFTYSGTGSVTFGTSASGSSNAVWNITGDVYATGIASLEFGSLYLQSREGETNVLYSTSGDDDSPFILVLSGDGDSSIGSPYRFISSNGDWDSTENDAILNTTASSVDKDKTLTIDATANDLEIAELRLEAGKVVATNSTDYTFIPDAVTTTVDGKVVHREVGEADEDGNYTVTYTLENPTISYGGSEYARFADAIYGATNADSSVTSIYISLIATNSEENVAIPNGFTIYITSGHDYFIGSFDTSLGGDYMFLFTPADMTEDRTLPDSHERYYTSTNLNVATAQNSEVKLELDDTSFLDVKGITHIGYATGAKGCIEVNGGSIRMTGKPRVGWGTGSTGDLVLNSGDVEIVGDETFIGCSGSEGRIEINGGTFTSRTLHVGRDGGTGEVDFVGGVSVISNNDWYNTLNAGWASNSKGTIVVSNDAEVVVWGKTKIACNNPGGSGEFKMYGGSFVVTNDNFYVGDEANTTGKVTVAGGHLQANAFYVGQNGDAEFTIDDGEVVSDGRFEMAHSATATGKLTMNGGTLTVGGWLSVADTSGAVGEMIMTDGSITAANAEFGQNGEGILTMSGGTFTTTGAFSIGEAASSTGRVYMTGGTITVGGEFRLANNKDSYGYMSISNAILDVAQWACIGRGSYEDVGTNRTAILEVFDDGQLIHQNYGCLVMGNFDAPGCHNELIVHEGGEVLSYSDIYIGERGSGILTIDGGYVETRGGTGVLMNYYDKGEIYDTSLIITNGGELVTRSIKKNAGSAPSSVYINNGTLTAYAAGTLIAANDYLTVTIGEEGGTIDDGGYSTTVAEDIVGTGTLTKVGKGALILTGAIATTGGIDVTDGALMVTNGYSFGDIPVNVGTNAAIIVDVRGVAESLSEGDTLELFTATDLTFDYDGDTVENTVYLLGLIDGYAVSRDETTGKVTATITSLANKSTSAKLTVWNGGADGTADPAYWHIDNDAHWSNGQPSSNYDLALIPGDGKIFYYRKNGTQPGMYLIRNGALTCVCSNNGNSTHPTLRTRRIAGVGTIRLEDVGLETTSGVDMLVDEGIVVEFANDLISATQDTWIKGDQAIITVNGDIVVTNGYLRPYGNYVVNGDYLLYYNSAYTGSASVKLCESTGLTNWINGSLTIGEGVTVTQGSGEIVLGDDATLYLEGGILSGVTNAWNEVNIRAGYNYYTNLPTLKTPEGGYTLAGGNLVMTLAEATSGGTNVVMSGGTLIIDGSTYQGTITIGTAIRLTYLDLDDSLNASDVIRVIGVPYDWTISGTGTNVTVTPGTPSGPNYWVGGDAGAWALAENWLYGIPTSTQTVAFTNDVEISQNTANTVYASNIVLRTPFVRFIGGGVWPKLRAVEINGDDGATIGLDCYGLSPLEGYNLAINVNVDMYTLNNPNQDCWIGGNSLTSRVQFNKGFYATNSVFRFNYAVDFNSGSWLYCDRTPTEIYDNRFRDGVVFKEGSTLDIGTNGLVYIQENASLNPVEFYGTLTGAGTFCNKDGKLYFAGDMQSFTGTVDAASSGSTYFYGDCTGASNATWTITKAVHLCDTNSASAPAEFHMGAVTCTSNIRFSVPSGAEFPIYIGAKDDVASTLTGACFGANASESLTIHKIGSNTLTYGCIGIANIYVDEGSLILAEYTNGATAYETIDYLEVADGAVLSGAYGTTIGELVLKSGSIFRQTVTESDGTYTCPTLPVSKLTIEDGAYVDIDGSDYLTGIYSSDKVRFTLLSYSSTESNSVETSDNNILSADGGSCYWRPFLWNNKLIYRVTNTQPGFIIRIR